MTAIRSDIHILGSEDDPARQAQDTLRRYGQQLLAELRAKSAMLVELQLEPPQRRDATVRLLEFCERGVAVYLNVVDRVLYAAAAGAAETRLLVRALRTLHRIIEQRIHDLHVAETPGDAAGAARAMTAILGGCQDIEHNVLFPALARLSGVDLPGLVVDIEALRAGGTLEIPARLDVREIPHGERHPRVFGIFARLAPGDAFILVNNHDPKPLRREFEATFPDEFCWEYIESGPARWQVRIRRGTPGTQS